MRERGVLMSGPMVRRIIAGLKLQTRRAMRRQPKRLGIYTTGDGSRQVDWCLVDKYGDPTDSEIRCPYGRPGDRLWVKETWAYDGPSLDAARAAVEDAMGPGSVGIYYRADMVHEDSGLRWRPSIFMPRWASRLLLDVTEVRVERLQAISEEDARAEGAAFHDGLGIGHSGWRHDEKEIHADARSSFARLWREINGPESWDENPWVWVVGFKIAAESAVQARAA